MSLDMEAIFNDYARPYLSDVFVPNDDGMYRNLMTGECMPVPCSNDKRYLVLNDMDYGYCAIRHGNDLFIFCLELNVQFCEWNINGYIMLCRNKNGYSCGDNVHFYLNKRYVDAFGQYVPSHDKNYTFLSRIELLYFFNGPYVNHNFELFCFSTGKEIYACVSDLNKYGHLGILDRSSKEVGHACLFDMPFGAPKSCTDTCILPDGAESSVMQFMQSSCAIRGTRIHDPFRFCAISYHGEDAVIRLFFCDVAALPDGGVCCAGIFEYMCFPVCNVSHVPVDTFHVPVLWIDEKIRQDFYVVPDVGSDLRDFVLCNGSPFLEMIYRYSRNIWDDYLKLVGYFHVDIAGYCLYGEVGESGSLHKRLGLPEYLLRRISSFEEPNRIILSIRKMFKLHPTYLKNLDRDSCDLLLNLVSTASDKVLNSVTCLVHLYGPKRYEKYFAHILGFHSVYHTVFLNYYERLYTAGRWVRKYFDWNVTPDDAEMFTDVLHEINIESARNGAGFDDYMSSFSVLTDKWEAYSFHRNGFLVTYPHSVMDFFMEGKKLRHCVASFINPCMEEKTVILFIRKESEPEKPYFTLEIRNGMIRQCHGFANCNIYDVPEKSQLVSFLHSFCDCKGITYSNGSSLCGIH